MTPHLTLTGTRVLPAGGLRGTDRDMAAHGVTTAFVAQSWS